MIWKYKKKKNLFHQLVGNQKENALLAPHYEQKHSYEAPVWMNFSTEECSFTDVGLCIPPNVSCNAICQAVSYIM